MRLCRMLLLVAAAPPLALAQPAPVRAPADSFTVMIEVPSRGDTLRGFIRVAQGAGPHLTVLYLSGFAEPAFPAFPATAQQAGFNGVGFNFRGSRRSSGYYTVDGTVDDAKAMLAVLRSDSAQRLWRVDPRRIVLVAASAGTLSALRTTADDKDIVCTAAMVPFNWAAAGIVARTDTAVRRQFENVMRSVTAGPEPVIRERGFLIRVLDSAESYDLVPVGAALGNRKVLLIGARQDATAPLPAHFTPLVEAIRKAGGAGLRDTVVDDTHNLTNTGDAVGAAIVRWLRSECAR
jgi:fermentation-respiration switch protein FrsA (DUF1100 family)